MELAAAKLGKKLKQRFHSFSGHDEGISEVVVALAIFERLGSNLAKALNHEDTSTKSLLLAFD